MESCPSQELGVPSSHPASKSLSAKSSVNSDGLLKINVKSYVFMAISTTVWAPVYRSISASGIFSARGLKLSGSQTPATETDVLWVITQIRRQPAFDFDQRHFFAAGVGLGLVAGDAVDGEVVAFGMARIQSLTLAAGHMA